MEYLFTSHALVADNTWKITGVPLSSIAYNIKFTNAADWKGNDWGNATGLSGSASLTTGGGPNINASILKSGTYTMVFNEKTLSYTIYPDVITDVKQSISLTETFSIYPNPISGNTCIVLNPSKVDIEHIQIMDYTGKIVSENSTHSAEPVIEVSVQHPAGMYIILIQYKEGIQAIRLLKQ